MTRIIVHARQAEDARGHDLEIPAEMPISELERIIPDVLNWPPCRGIHVEGTGQVLGANETLASAGVWDGASLVFGSRMGRSDRAAEPGRASLKSETCVYRLTGPEMRLGRGSSESTGDATPLLDLGGEPLGSTVGRNHARARLVDGTWLVEALPATKGITLLNGAVAGPGQRYALADGDCLQLGGVRLWFSTKNGTAQ
jgi:hypothetical protein